MYRVDITVPFCASILAMTVISWIILIRFYRVKYLHFWRSLSPHDPIAPVGRRNTMERASHSAQPPFWRSHMLGGFLIEFVTLSIMPFPWLPPIWFECLALFVILRLYLFVRTCRDLSRLRLHNAAGSLVRTPSISWRISIKLLYNQQLTLCLCIFALSFFILSFVTHIVERDCEPAFRTSGTPRGL